MLRAGTVATSQWLLNCQLYSLFCWSLLACKSGACKQRNAFFIHCRLLCLPRHARSRFSESLHLLRGAFIHP